MNHHRELIAGTIAAVAFDPHGWFAWFGNQAPGPSQRVRGALSPDALRSCLLLELRQRLYDDLYTRGAVPTDTEFDEPSTLGQGSEFSTLLSAANSGAGSWDRGWTVLRDEGAMFVIARNRLTLRAGPGEIEWNSGRRPSRGTDVALRMPKELRAASPGFYLALSDEAMPEPEGPIVRVYWNVSPEGAIRLMRRATHRLNEARHPFRLKALGDHGAYRRCDAVVLYFPKRDFERVTPILGELYREAVSFLKPLIPAFTKRLASGVALAENPSSGESFGMSRCEILAEGLLLAHEAGERSLPGRLRVIETHFLERGVDPSRPYLGPGSSDSYDVDFDGMQVGSGNKPRVGGGSRPHLDSEMLLAAAAQIGGRLAKETIWLDDRCCWVGPDARSDRLGKPQAKTWSAVGPSLYSGTGGIALFLAELHAATGDPLSRQTALGAIRNALSAAESPGFDHGPGLYTGWSGVALAAARCGLLLREADLPEHGLNLALRLGETAARCEHFDLMAGKAGVIVALLAIRDLLDDARLLDLSERLGNSLLESAERDRPGLSWRNPGVRARHNLTGFSHGASGVGHAFLELYRENRDDRFRQAAEATFDYERRWFDGDAGNWSDLREGPSAGPRRSRREAFAVAWCHGAPGIALARMRAHEILGPGAHTGEARIGLVTTRRDVERGLPTAERGYSLCHGLTGEAEVILCGSRMIPESADCEDIGLLLDIARAGIRDLELDCPRSELDADALPPGLMLGLAGFGHLLLRLRDPRIPSALLIRSETFRGGDHFTGRGS